MHFSLHDLGIQSLGDTWCNWRHARHPHTGADLLLGSLANSGFMLIDPRTHDACQVMLAQRVTTAWAVGQAPDGSVYQAGFASRATANVLTRWNWEGTQASVIAALPCRSLFTLDIGSDGLVYLPDYGTNTLYAFDPAHDALTQLRDFHDFGHHIRDFYCAPDGYGYLSCTDYAAPCVLAVDLATLATTVVTITGDEVASRTGQLGKDSLGRVLMRSHGKYWRLEAGEPVLLSPDDPILRRLPLAAAWAGIYSDGSYVAGIEDDTRQATMTFVDATDHACIFTVSRTNPPLRIFSLASGASQIWGSTFIPLTLFSCATPTAQNQQYGNPTESTGEIYAIVESQGQVYCASYPDATLTRFDPQTPTQPVHLGLMKDEGLHLHRPYGKAIDPNGRVFFAAKGDYGCRDSGVCRIDPWTDAVIRWIYPDTTFTAMTYLPRHGQLLVCEQRPGDSGVRATFLCPETGALLRSVQLDSRPGEIHSWLPDGDDLVYGLHGRYATLFAFSLTEHRIVMATPELPFGDHCHECLLFGPDDQIWGLTNRCVFAVSRDLQHQHVVADYADYGVHTHYRFGMVFGADGALYFPNGEHLMRLQLT